MIEMALVLVPLLAIVCGFFDLCMVTMRWTTLQNAVREGARYAVTFQRVSGLGQDASIRTAVERYSMGLVSASANPPRITVEYFSPGAPNTPIPAPNGNVPGNIVQVSVVNYPWAWLAPISGTLSNPFWATSPFQITVLSSDILGGYPVGLTSVPR